MIIFESLDDLTGSYSVYSLFFDIATKKILLNNWASFNDVGHINNFTNLKKPTIEIINYLEKEVYTEKRKRYTNTK